MTEQTMRGGVDANSVRKVASVQAPPAVAWRVFTEKMGTWWPLATYKIGKARAVDAVIEPRVGGRWYERGEDGSTSDWGEVLTWEPHTRLVLSWDINADWQHDPALKTEIEVRFIAEGTGGTRIELEHRHLDRYGVRRDEMRRIFDTEGDWGRLLKLFARAAGATSPYTGNGVPDFTQARKGVDHMVTKPKRIPDSYRRVTPCLIVQGGAKALEFYADVFGSTERMRFPGPGGTIAHAEIQIGDSVIIIEDESPERGTKAPPPGGFGGSPSFLFIYVEDVDAVITHAVKLGAKLQRPPKDQFYGDRDGYIVDPFGHGWTIATHVEDVEPAEMMRRMEDLMKVAG